jgi:crotonobetainyl-CoA:carnitine CoA-transferase CaiB-like acyl-CoA transferase
MTSGQTPFRPLAGIKVIDFSHVIAGPLASFYLAQMGADVVKVESPSGGDVMRTARGAESFLALNAGKRELRSWTACARAHWSGAAWGPRRCRP